MNKFSMMFSNSVGCIAIAFGTCQTVRCILDGLGGEYSLLFVAMAIAGWSMFGATDDEDSEESEVYGA